MKCYLRRLSIIAAFFVVFSAHYAAAERLSVSAQIANIRSGPATTYDILWQVQKYYPILVLKKSGPWINFKDFEGDEGWIHRSLIQQTPTVITIKEKCNIRSGPGAQNRILFTVEKGMMLASHQAVHYKGTLEVANESNIVIEYLFPTVQV